MLASLATFAVRGQFGRSKMRRSRLPAPWFKWHQFKWSNCYLFEDITRHSLIVYARAAILSNHLSQSTFTMKQNYALQKCAAGAKNLLGNILWFNPHFREMVYKRKLNSFNADEHQVQWCKLLLNLNIRRAYPDLCKITSLFTKYLRVWCLLILRITNHSFLNIVVSKSGCATICDSVMLTCGRVILHNSLHLMRSVKWEISELSKCDPRFEQRLK
jgi:hypothetical protein